MTIKLLILDIDGTMTDGSIYIGENGESFKRFYCRDGLAILFLKKAGILPVIITARESRIVLNRAKELGITEIYQNQKQKEDLLPVLCRKYGIFREEIAYIGDDINDLKIMKQCGIKLCPKDARPEIRAISDYVSVYKGGSGAVRDCLEYLFRQTGCFDQFIQQYS